MLENLIQATEHLVGFLIVLMALTLLWGATALMGKLFAAFAPKAEAKPAPMAAFATSEEEDEDLVVVATAVAQMLDERHRIVSIRPQASSWGQQGRREIHASHNIR